MSVTLAKDYGRSEEYTEGQVKTALRKLGYSGDFEEVGITIWCNQENARRLGLDDALIKKYRGYPLIHDLSPGGGDFSGGDAGDAD